MLFLFSSNFAFLLSLWKRQARVNVQFALNKNRALEVYGVFAVYPFLLNNFSRVINLLLTKLARDRTRRISALSLSCTGLAALGLYCQDLGPTFSQYGPHAWSIRYIYQPYVLDQYEYIWILIQSCFVDQQTLIHSYMYMYIHIHSCTFTYIHIHSCTFMFIHVHVCTFTCPHADITAP